MQSPTSIIRKAFRLSLNESLIPDIDHESLTDECGSTQSEATKKIEKCPKCGRKLVSQGWCNNCGYRKTDAMDESFVDSQGTLNMTGEYTENSVGIYADGSLGMTHTCETAIKLAKQAGFEPQLEQDNMGTQQ